MGDQDMGEEGIFLGGLVAGLWGIWEQIFGGLAADFFWDWWQFFWGIGGSFLGGLVAVFFRGEADLRVGWRQFFEKL